MRAVPVILYLCEKCAKRIGVSHHSKTYAHRCDMLHIPTGSLEERIIFAAIWKGERRAR